MLSLSKAIGGYFELETPKIFNDKYPQSFKYQSARAAFYSLIQYVKPAAIWMPRYLCNSMFEAPKDLGIRINLYSLNEDFSIKENISLKKGEIILYVNYFGLCRKNQEELLKKYPSDSLVFDNSQAFYQEPLGCLATIYSPRKFFGLPDGGLLVTKLPIEKPNKQDVDSLARATHLLKRLAFDAEDGYADYQKADESLIGLEPMAMSKLTYLLYSSIDHETAGKIRNKNFNNLHGELSKLNNLQIDFLENSKPLIYPFLSNNNKQKSILIKERIYTATYWPDCLERLEKNSFEFKLLENMVALPCDQRYSEIEMNKIIKLIG